MWFGDPEQPSGTRFINMLIDLVETRATGIELKKLP